MKTAFSILVLSILFLCQVQNLMGQEILVKPYIQDVEPTSAYILWETSVGLESKVEWGLTETMGNESVGNAFPSNGGDEMIHEVKLENLTKFTRYYYKVITETTESEIYHFKTPPFSSDDEAFRIVAMSDMQRDASKPDKFREIVEDGVLNYLEETVGGDIVDDLALVMIPGDLVVNGTNYGSWKNTFFQPAEKLMSKIPVYPVPGNHENDAQFFFSYFKLPDNGTDGYEEHWWHKDYGNVRLVGMDSNGPYRIQEQLDWLQELLNNTCAEDSIDFVFAQLHHPHKSELWTPGEADYTGDVIELLENFSTNCNKPSIHFFGHTHGYSRGQSRDHKHLWINAATAGGAIDNWGEFPNFDYDEFSVSQDEYGFVLLEITGGDDPEVTIKRISRGDQDVTLENEVRDQLTIKLSSSVVNTPIAVFPVDITIAPECIVLEGNEFSSADQNMLHGQSHWQVDVAGGDFSSPIVDSWKNFENWYNEEDTQAGDILIDEKVKTLESLTDYQWRVRYRDQEMNWSEWSSVAIFSTEASNNSENLILNPGAENDLENWTIVEGIVESLDPGICDGINPYAGNKYFGVGGICESSAVGIATQDIDLDIYVDSIDAGNYSVSYGGYLTNFSGSDRPSMRLEFLDEMGDVLAESETLTTLSSSWTLLQNTMVIPSQTRTIRVELKGERNAGTDNDSYFDDLFVTVGPEVDCSAISGINYMPTSLTLVISPNPASDKVRISIPDNFEVGSKLFVTDEAGQKISCTYNKVKESIIIDSHNLTSGIYYVYLRNKLGVIATGKLVIARN